ncbi:uncharacterized protein F4812DRAFT_128443 [Daldinia caldariorum]|uniref:uncharacterized protein n=1 Tax=Daldinia caldariorum TaxID=326644 RepID=UPI002007CA39|nr:uncharacterized protein F4812DRAFT_128443 [Daldinia caldariorum]KAI1465030.1 hypothetical protein F4812DRAFT_128443 [Daldinia caldariorum]
MGSRTSDDNEQGESLLPPNQEGHNLLSGPYRLSARYQWISTACAVVVSLIVGYILGLSHVKERSRAQYGLPMPPGSIHITWEHNLTFTQKPSPASEAAWASIIPAGRGFVHHPQLAPFISNIATFHQLHCLHAIVVAYYEALESPPLTNLSSIPEFENSTSTRIAPFHIRHCFDYIRQALMCAADTNLEVLDHETHLTNGWGQPKQCRDYEHVFTWAERYANSSDTGIVT